MAREKANDNIPLRVAYHGGRHGLGSLAFRRLRDHDGVRFEARAAKAEDRPQATAEHAIAAVLSGKADRALLPFFNERSGYVPETVAALARNPGVAILGETLAKDQYCLAVPIEHVRQRDESSFTPEKARRGLALNYGRFLDAAGALTRRSDNGSLMDLQREQERWTSQITDIFVSPDAERACSSALANYAADGVSVRSLGDERATVRDFLNMSAKALDADRTVQSRVGDDNKLVVTNTIKGSARTRPVYGVVLPYEQAFRNEELFIVEPEFEQGGAEEATRFVYVAPRDDTPWPDDVRTWANGEARIAGFIPVDPSRWWGTIARQFIGSDMIAAGVRDQYADDKPVLRLVLIAAADRGDRAAPTLARVENYARRRKLSFQTGSIRLGDGSPAEVLELEVESDRKGRWLEIVKRMRAGKAGSVSVLGGFAVPEPVLKYRGQGSTLGEVIGDFVG